MCRINEGEFDSFDIVPEDYGFTTCDLSELIGGSPVKNAEITRNILSGAEKGAKRNVVILNAALCLAAALEKDICCLLYTSNTKVKPGDAVLFDVGCIKDGYCSDMTRTFYFKEVSDIHRRIYETCLLYTSRCV